MGKLKWMSVAAEWTPSSEFNCQVEAQVEWTPELSGLNSAHRSALQAAGGLFLQCLCSAFPRKRCLFFADVPEVKDTYAPRTRVPTGVGLCLPTAEWAGG